MSGTPIVTKSGPRTYVPADNTVVKGGLLVAGTTGGRIVIAGANSPLVLGVALNDAVAPEDRATESTDGLGRPVVPFVPVPESVAVAYGGAEVRVTYAADAAFGQKLVAAANGTVTPAGTTPDARFIVGTCTEPAGVTVAQNAVGLMRTV